MARLVRPTSTVQPGSSSSGQNTPTPSGGAHTLKICVAHGDLRRAKYPLAIGHYHGDAIVHAERLLDEQLCGRLTMLFNMYLYPGAEGTSEVIHVNTAAPPGALVIGLGDVGDIKPVTVRNGVANVALRHALAVLNESQNLCAPGADLPGVAVGFSTLLLGTYGGNALTIEQSLTAIIQGTIQANEVLRAQNLLERVHIHEVQIIELYEDVALEAMRVAVYLSEHPPMTLTAGDKLQVEPPYLFPLGNGRNQRPVDPYAQGWWRRIQITCQEEKDGGEGLRFLALTDRARAEDTLQFTQRKFIEKAIEKAVTSPSFSADLSTMLYKLLIPASIKDQTSAESDLVLVVDAAAAQYPWELLAERTRKGVEPFAVRVGLIRQFKTANFMLSPQPARESNALVVGVPKSGEMDLPGARSEAKQVAAVLEQAGYDTGGGALTDAAPLDVMGRLFARGYKILHLAGHGQYVAGKPGESGMILDEGMYLTSKEIRNLDPLPELVFINCCYLGKLDTGPAQLGTNAPHALAASIAQELIEMGVKTVVAAGWAVEDKAAAAFATTFYAEMLRGVKFGMAVKAARIAARETTPASNTWGAYQCYGNPDFVLEQTSRGNRHVNAQAVRCFSQRDFLEKLTDIKADAARTDNDDQLVQLGDRIAELDQALPAMWRDGLLLRAFGAAWAALGSFDKAIECYRTAALEEKAEAPLNTVEQLANILGRHADRLRAQQSAGPNGDGSGPTPGPLLDEAFKHLNWLLELGESAERYALMGSYYKRKAAAATTVAERVQFLKLAEENYGKAHLFYKNKLGYVNPYPTLNWLTYRILRGEAVATDFALIDECIEAARRAETQEPKFYNRVTEPDGELLRHLMQGDLAAHLDDIIELYRKAMRIGATRRELSSVINQFDFLREMLVGLPPGGPVTPANINALTRLRAAFNFKHLSH